MTAKRTPENLEYTLSAARTATGIFIRHTPDRARADLDLSRTGALSGVPYVVKDVLNVAGTPTTAGSRSREGDEPAGQDAAAVARLGDAGAVLVGKVTLSELAYSGLGVNRWFGTPTRLVNGREHLVGGSSSGSASAVATGLVPFALGTDTSGSTRVPAAWSGVIGYRPSEGRYSTSGVFALSPTLDTVGVFTRDPDMVRQVDAVLRPGHLMQVPSTPHMLVVPDGVLTDGCSPEVRDGLDRVIELLADQGWTIETERMDSIETAREILDRYPRIVDVEAAQRFGHLLHTPDVLESFTVRRLAHAVEAAGGDSAQTAFDAMEDLRQRFTAELAGRILLTPAVSILAPTPEELADPDTEDAINALTLRISMTLSYLGSPGITIPCPLADKTFGALLSAAPGHDCMLLGALPTAWRALNPTPPKNPPAAGHP